MDLVEDVSRLETPLNIDAPKEV